MKRQQSQQVPAKLPESEEEEPEKVIKLLEERLEKHDNNRKAVQGKLTEILSRLTEKIDYLEERINKELYEKFIPEEDRLQAALNEFRGNSTVSALQEVKKELRTTQSYEIIENDEPSNDLTTLYELKTERSTIHGDDSVGIVISDVDSSTHGRSNSTEIDEAPCDSDKFAEEREHLIELLEERLAKHEDNKKAAQDKLHEICERLRTQIDELEDRINKELEEKFTSVDNRLQSALNELRGNSTTSALQKAKAEFIVEQSYEIIENKKVKYDLTTLYRLKVERRIIPELIETRKPTNVRVAGVNKGIVSVQFTCLNPDEERVLSDYATINPVKYKCLLFKKGDERKSKEEESSPSSLSRRHSLYFRPLSFLEHESYDIFASRRPSVNVKKEGEYPLDKNGGNDSFLFTPDILGTETTYGIRVKMVVGDRESEWGDITEFTTPEFGDCCVWKKCPDYVDDKNGKYDVDEKNPRIATKVNSNDYCTIIGNAYIPPNRVTSWSIKILKSKNNDGDGIYIGIAPFNINQNDNNYNKCGWYFNCYRSTLRSGPPHYYDKKYGPRKRKGQYVHTGDSVGVVVDTTKGGLSFVLNGVNLGVAYCGIPLDEPLVPCVILGYNRGSVELDTSEVKETEVDSSIPFLSNIAPKSTSWDSITITWDEVADTSFYQIEVDGSKSWGSSTTNTFTKRGFLPETEHSFRVRTVRGSSVSKWSDVAKGKTLKESFEASAWKEYSSYISDEKNPRIATKVNGGLECIIIGNTPIPPNKVTRWNIKIHKSKNNNGDSVFIGIAPININQNKNYYDERGWYFNCYDSTLRSGPPHKYDGKKYGPRKRKGQYVHTGDAVCVVVDTTKGKLSFVLNGVNLGVAYEGIPLDKPLVPCILLGCKDDSVEFDTSEVKEDEVDSSVPIPSNITTKSTTYDSITLTWDELSDTSFYQIEVDGSKSWGSSTTNTFTKRGFLPETEHSFRVRTVRGSSVSKWSDVAKGRTLKAPEFSECAWKKCPDYVDYSRKYGVDEKNPRIAAKINDGDYNCTIIGNTPIPPNTMTSWNIKILKLKKDNGNDIYIGVAPFDINQNDHKNYEKCGWYFYCCYSCLRSGPPHDCWSKPYGPRKWEGQYVHTRDTVGVVVDTTKGELSFVLDGVNPGVAYEGIPLDKPLVPCVLIGTKGDSAEITI